MTGSSTLFKPLPADPLQSIIENHLELTDLSLIEPNLFTNARPVWRPPGAKGIFGGVLIAQCLAAAFKTVPTNFDVHSLHCYFMLPGNDIYPIMYHVEHDRTGKSFAVRSVKAIQNGNCIFKTTMSFALDSGGNRVKLQHALPLPDDIKIPTEDHDLSRIKESRSPLIVQHEMVSKQHGQRVYDSRIRYWTKVKGRISEAGGRQAHLIALAYLSDNLFLGTVNAIHSLDESEYEGRKKHRQKNEDDNVVQETKSSTEMGMAVSLDHTIYFHAPKNFRADEWMLSDMSSPWSGQERGLVMQHIFSVNGTLIATCYQEGVLRLNQAKPSKDSKL